MEYRACDDLFVEFPQVFDTPATARDDDEIDRGKRFVRRCQLANGDSDFLSCAGSLHTDGIDQNLQPRRATTEHVQHVTDGSSAWRGHNSNSPWKFRQRP